MNFDHTNQDDIIKEEKSSLYILRRIRHLSRMMRSTLYSLLLLIITSSLAVVFALYINDYDTTLEENGIVIKESLVKPIQSIIKNNGDLGAIKHVFESRKKEKYSLFRRNKGDFYPYETSLDVVLNDLKCDYLSNDPFENDSVYYSRLLYLIQENEYHNPFDNLETVQQYYFENIRVKSADNYSLLQPDVQKIADELLNKNVLVERYLNKSSISFIISIIALCLTIILSIIQIIQNHKTSDNINKLIKERVEVIQKKDTE